ncbi:MAG: dihydrofolate reductase family protein [Gemmatimonadaceae bacterium]
MPTLSVFNTVSLDGYFVSSTGDMSWAHAGSDDKEWNDFVSGNASGDGTLIFGRVTYDMMSSYWPTPMAMQNSPEVAKGMKALSKVVFSRTLKSASWSNTTLVKDDMIESMRAMKSGSGNPMTILGSGSVVSQFADAGLIDEYQLVIKPIALGAGRTMFDGLATPLHLRLRTSRQFANGNVLLCYEPNA